MGAVAVALVLLLVGCRGSQDSNRSKNLSLKYAFCSGSCVSSADWTTLAADAAEGVGQYVSLAFTSDNRPAMAYYDAKNQDLIYASCLGSCQTTAPRWSFCVPSCALDSLTRVDAIGNVGRHAVLKLTTKDLPRIGYEAVSADGTLHSLKYALYDPTLSSLWIIRTIDAGGGGEYLSMALKDDQPRVAYYDRKTGAVKYAFCLSNCSPASDKITATVDAQVGTIPTTVERAISIALDKSGNPRIAYYDVTGGNNLKYAICTANCALGSTASPLWLVSVVDAGVNDVGQYPSLALDASDIPSITYYDATRGILKYATCTADCLTLPRWSSPAEITGQGQAGTFSSLRVDSVNTKVAFYDITQDALNYAFCTPLVGKPCTDAASWTTVKVEGPGAGRFASLGADSNNLPRIGYLSEQ